MLCIVIIGFAKLKVSDSRDACPYKNEVMIAFGKYHCRFHRQYHYKKGSEKSELFSSIKQPSLEGSEAAKR